MESTSRYTAAPPAAWAVTALVLPSLIMALTWHADVHGAATAFEALGKRRLGAFARDAATLPPGGRRVVMLGNSALRDATDPDPVMASRLAGLLGRPVQLVRLVRPTADLVDFEPLWSAVAAAAPDLVVIQADVAVALAPLAVLDRRFARVRSHIQNLARGRTDFGEHLARAQETAKWLPELPATNLAAVRTGYLAAAPFQRPPGPEAVARLRVVAGMSRAVIVIDVPHADDFEDHTATAKDAWFQALGTTLGGAVSVARFPRRLGRRAFIDGIHMAPDARGRYLAWFVPVLAAALRDATP